MEQGRPAFLMPSGHTPCSFSSSKRWVGHVDLQKVIIKNQTEILPSDAGTQKYARFPLLRPNFCHNLELGHVSSGLWF